MADTKLTTVKIIKNLYSKFKKISFDSNITLQKLVNRSVDMYIEDEDLRKRLRILTMKQQDNGNNQLNQTREEFNDRIIRKKFLGNTPRVYWNSSRRFRTI